MVSLAVFQSGIAPRSSYSLDEQRRSSWPPAAPAPCRAIRRRAPIAAQWRARPGPGPWARRQRQAHRDPAAAGRCGLDLAGRPRCRCQLQGRPASHRDTGQPGRGTGGGRRQWAAAAGGARLTQAGWQLLAGADRHELSAPPAAGRACSRRRGIGGRRRAGPAHQPAQPAAPTVSALQRVAGQVRVRLDLGAGADHRAHHARERPAARSAEGLARAGSVQGPPACRWPLALCATARTGPAGTVTPQPPGGVGRRVSAAPGLGQRLVGFCSGRRRCGSGRWPWPAWTRWACDCAHG